MDKSKTIKEANDFALEYFSNGDKEDHEELKMAGGIDDETIIGFVNQLEAEGKISFSLYPHSTDGDYWISAETGARIKFKDGKERYIAIPIDNDVRLPDSLEDVIEEIAEWEYQATIILNNLPN